MLLSGLLCYFAGNAIVIGQSWIGHNPKVRSSSHVNLFVFALFTAMGLGVVLTIVGLVFVFMVHWWLALLLLVIGEPFFAKRMFG